MVFFVKCQMYGKLNINIYSIGIVDSYKIHTLSFFICDYTFIVFRLNCFKLFETVISGPFKEYYAVWALRIVALAIIPLLLFYIQADNHTIKFFLLQWFLSGKKLSVFSSKYLFLFLIFKTSSITDVEYSLEYFQHYAVPSITIDNICLFLEYVLLLNFAEHLLFNM